MLNRTYLFLIPISLLFILQFWFTMWIGDDALITLRQVMMFVQGKGIVWNEGVRVQSFTHPLWFLILSTGYAVSGSLFGMTIVLSFASVATALWMFWRYCLRHTNNLIVASMFLLLPLLSTPFRDYSSSGLENPLSALLISLIFLTIPAVIRGQKQFWMWTLLAAVVLTRADHAIHFIPLAIWMLYRDHSLKAFRALFIPGLVFFAWFAFATFYFGHPLPNTYLAKVNTWLPLSVKLDSGLGYYLTALKTEPFTMVIIVLGMVAGAFTRGPTRLLALGVASHMAYVIWVGGGFMRGRFLMDDFFISLFLLVPAAVKIAAHNPQRLILVLPMFGVLFDQAYYVDKTSSNFVASELTASSDERLFYMPFFGATAKHLKWPETEHLTPDHPQRLEVYSGCGLIGDARFRFDNSVFIVDLCALTDPFLSRLPLYADIDYRVGHFLRRVPENYMAMIKGEETIPNQVSTTELWQDLWQVTRAPLFSSERTEALWRVIKNDYSINYDYWYSDVDYEPPLISLLYCTSDDLVGPFKPSSAYNSGLIYWFCRL